MARLPKGKFTFPLEEAAEKINITNDKTCVISIIGKSVYEANNCKAEIVDGILERSIFQVPEEEDLDKSSEEQVTIEGYHDAENNVIYLHMIGVFDARRLVKVCNQYQFQLENQGFLHSWAEMKYSQAKGLLFLFSVSHIVAIVHPVPTFDVSYVHLFRTVDGIRQKAQPYLAEMLKDCPVSVDWAQAGRPCSPRALFLFQAYSSDGWEENGGRNGSSSRSSKKFPPIKKLAHALEDQIYRILRKSRVITNISMNSLFAIPANQEFVYVQVSDGQTSDPLTYLLHQLHQQCLLSLEDNGSPSHNSASSSSTATKEGSPISITSGFNNKDNENSFRSFLWQHVELAFSKGFDDNVGRHSGTSVFELPSCKSWFKVASSIYKLFFAETESNETFTKDILGSLRSQIDVDGRFSEARCLKVLPVATAAYQEGLPSHYSSEVHHSQLAQAYHMFALHARGPAFEQYALQLHDECEKFWKNGHQLCEVHSLTGNPCLKPIHRLLTDIEEPDQVDVRSQLPVLPHCSQVKITSACNCGRKQASRDDPFDSKAANYDFYEQLLTKCCFEIERFEFPVFQPSTSDFKAAKITISQWTPSRIDGSKREISTTIARDDGNTGGGMSLALSLGQSLGASGEASQNLSLPADQSPDPNIGRSGDILSMSELTTASSISEKEEKMLIRQVSTTEYLPGMLHSDSPTGLLPAFPSWSLVCLGPSSLYSHNIGIQDQPGFISSTNFLLPWDVTVKSDSKDKWPTIAETSGKKGHQLKGKKGGRDSTEFTVKIFLGVEYECPRGHRFMCSAPDKILKASGSGLVKENATKITSNDMPLYFPCPCRTGKPVIAQLMRIHVVTPKAPVHVTLDPKVQPAPNSCPIFYPGNQEPVKLTQSTYWVLRLPFIYEGDQKAYIPPKDKKVPSYGRLLKGIYNVVHVAQEK